MSWYDDWTGATDRALLRSILAELTAIKGVLMTLADDLNAKLDASLANQAAMQTSLTAIAADEAGLKQQIADLIAAGGGGISATDAQALLAKATTLADASAAAASQAAGIDAATP